LKPQFLLWYFCAKKLGYYLSDKKEKDVFVANYFLSDLYLYFLLLCFYFYLKKEGLLCLFII